MPLSIAAAHDLARRAARGAGAAEAVAIALADATVAAERAGRASVGFAHLPDYLDGFASGRISADAEPAVTFPAPAIASVDARGGLAQLGFDRAFDALVERAGSFGLAALALHNGYTAGEIGYYTRRLAEAGLVALAASNGPALVTAGANRAAVYGTNPFSFAAPAADGPPVVIDQASSATAFVNVRAAAERGEAIPEGWAVDGDGQPTTDARAAVEGLLLTFGGPRGANIALMVEILAAGLTGANWSADAPSFSGGTASPAVGLFVIALKPDLLAPDFAARLGTQAARLGAAGIHVPGRRAPRETIVIAAPVMAALAPYLGP